MMTETSSIHVLNEEEIKIKKLLCEVHSLYEML